jgi:CBS domain-containing protein
MTRTPLLIGEDHSLETLLLFMRDAGVRRVPVVGKKHELVGVLSFDDVIRRIGLHLSCIAESIRNQQQIERLVRP